MQLVDAISGEHLQTLVARPLALALARQLLSQGGASAAFVGGDTLSRLGTAPSCLILEALGEEGDGRNEELRTVAGKVASLLCTFLSEGPNDNTPNVLGCLEAWCPRGLSLSALQETGLLGMLLEALDMPALSVRCCRCLAAACSVETVSSSDALVPLVASALAGLVPRYEEAIATGDDDLRVHLANAVVACGSSFRMHFFDEPPPPAMLRLAGVALLLVDDPERGVVEATFPLWDCLTDATPTPTPSFLSQLFASLVVQLLQRCVASWPGVTCRGGLFCASSSRDGGWGILAYVVVRLSSAARCLPCQGAGVGTCLSCATRHHHNHNHHSYCMGLTRTCCA